MEKFDVAVDDLASVVPSPRDVESDRGRTEEGHGLQPGAENWAPYVEGDDRDSARLSVAQYAVVV